MVKLSSDPLSWLAYALFLVGAPLLGGIVNKLKARLSGRLGPTIFQPYFDLLRLARKETVYSTSAGFISRLAPVIVWCTVAFAALFLPLGHQAAVSFPGEIILFAYLLALGRFFQILAALDVASSFEGMGASQRRVSPYLPNQSSSSLSAAWRSSRGVIRLRRSSPRSHGMTHFFLSLCRWVLSRFSF